MPAVGSPGASARALRGGTATELESSTVAAMASRPIQPDARFEAPRSITCRLPLARALAAGPLRCVMQRYTRPGGDLVEVGLSPGFRRHDSADGGPGGKPWCATAARQNTVDHDCTAPGRPTASARQAERGQRCLEDQQRDCAAAGVEPGDLAASGAPAGGGRGGPAQPVFERSAGPAAPALAHAERDVRSD